MNANRRAFAIFNTLLLPALPGLWLYTQWRRCVQGKSAASTRGMWGHIPRDVRRILGEKRQSGAPILWLHSVSVGEVMAARIVARALRHHAPHAAIALSTTTDTGMETARAALQNGEFDVAFFYPIDAPVAARRALNAIRPQIFVTMETELWPNFLSLARARGVQCFLVNGRVSDRLQRDALRLALLWRWMLPNFSALLMRSDEDAARMRELIESTRTVGPPVEIVGDVKLDQVSPADDLSAQRASWRRALGLSDDALLWVAGSTHAGEEEIMLAAYAALKNEFAALRLVIAPRHIERSGEVAALIEARGFKAARRSAESIRDDAVIVLDTVGELSQLYAAGELSFVGGSLIERGGHNLLEPVLRGVAVLWGPHVANFRASAILVESAEVGSCVADEAELIAAARHWLGDESARRAVPQRAKHALQNHRGAADRVARILADALENGAEAA